VWCETPGEHEEPLMGLWHLSVPVENITCAPGTQDTIFICHRKEGASPLSSKEAFINFQSENFVLVSPGLPKRLWCPTAACQPRPCAAQVAVPAKYHILCAFSSYSWLTMASQFLKPLQGFLLPMAQLDSCPSLCLQQH